MPTSSSNQSDVAVRVDGISKLYHLGGRQERYRTLRDTLTASIAAPFLRVARAFRGARATGDAEILWALKDISFEVKRGEVLGIIGRNGAGKSTMLKILSRITDPTSGHADVYGRIGCLLEVGSGFHPELTGRENVFLNGAILGMRRAEIERNFDEIVAFAEVERFIDTPVKRYSSGMYLRLAFAVAAHLEPEILIIDEVLAVGDFDFQKKCLGKMRDVAGSGRTVIFVSHNMGAVQQLCDRAILLDHGQIGFDAGPVKDVIDQYLSSGVKIGHDGVIPDEARRFSTGEAKFTHALVVNEDGHAVHEVRYCDPVRLKLRLEVQAEIRDALIDVRVVSEGIELTHSMMKRLGGERLILEPGVYDVDVSLENPLQPGRYLLTFGIHFSNGATIDYIENALEIRVLSVARNAEEGWTHTWTAGLIRLDADWHIARA